MKEILSRLTSSIIIAFSIIVSTKMYVDSNKHTFLGENGQVYAVTQDGDLCWKESQYFSPLF